MTGVRSPSALPDPRRFRREAVAWAKKVSGGEGFVVLDSETTGLRAPVEFVEIAVVEHVPGHGHARVLLDTLVRPSVPVERRATEVHGLGASDLADAPPFEEVYPELVRVLAGRRAIAYNAAFDRRIYEGCLERRGLPDAAPHPEADPEKPWECAMLWYSRFASEPDPKNGRRLKRHKLGDVTSGSDHTALGDARATLGLILRMAAPAEEPEGATRGPGGVGRRRR